MESEWLTSSNFKITPEEWQLTPPSVQRVILHELERLAALEEEVSGLRAENERLREQTRRFSRRENRDRKSTRLNSSHRTISYAVFCLKKKKNKPSKHSPRHR